MGRRKTAFLPPSHYSPRSPCPCFSLGAWETTRDKSAYCPHSLILADHLLRCWIPNNHFEYFKSPELRIWVGVKSKATGSWFDNVALTTCRFSARAKLKEMRRSRSRDLVRKERWMNTDLICMNYVKACTKANPFTDKAFLYFSCPTRLFTLMGQLVMWFAQQETKSTPSTSS